MLVLQAILPLGLVVYKKNAQIRVRILGCLLNALLTTKVMTGDAPSFIKLLSTEGLDENSCGSTPHSHESG